MSVTFDARIRAVTSEFAPVHAVLGGQPIDAQAERLVLEFDPVSPNDRPNVWRLPVVSTDELEAQRRDFVAGAMVSITIVPRAEPMDQQTVEPPHMPDAPMVVPDVVAPPVVEAAPVAPAMQVEAPAPVMPSA